MLTDLKHDTFKICSRLIFSWLQVNFIFNYLCDTIKYFFL